MTSNDKQLSIAAEAAAAAAAASSVTPASARPRSPRAEDSLAEPTPSSSSSSSSSSPNTASGNDSSSKAAPFVSMTPRKEGSTRGMGSAGYGQGLPGTSTTVSTYHSLPEPRGSPR